MEALLTDLPSPHSHSEDLTRNVEDFRGTLKILEALLTDIPFTRRTQIGPSSDPSNNNSASFAPNPPTLLNATRI